MKLVTPALGTLELSAEKDPELFRLARVGLGALGVVSELTLQCVPAHQLLEHTFVASRRVRRGQAGRQTGRQADRQTDRRVRRRQADRQTDGCGVGTQAVRLHGWRAVWIDDMRAVLRQSYQPLGAFVFVAGGCGFVGGGMMGGQANRLTCGWEKG
jgi:hypothetical protein